MQGTLRERERRGNDVKCRIAAAVVMMDVAQCRVMLYVFRATKKRQRLRYGNVDEGLLRLQEKRVWVTGSETFVLRWAKGKGAGLLGRRVGGEGIL